MLDLMKSIGRTHSNEIGLLGSETGGGTPGWMERSELLAIFNPNLGTLNKFSSVVFMRFASVRSSSEKRT